MNFKNRAVKPPESYNVSAAPNESVIRGKVLRIRPAPGGIGALWDVEIQETENVGDLANLARARTNECVQIYIHPGFKGTIREGDVIEAQIFFEGDERGGAFFLKGEDVHRKS